MNNNLSIQAFDFESNAKLKRIMRFCLNVCYILLTPAMILTLLYIFGVAVVLEETSGEWGQRSDPKSALILTAIYCIFAVPAWIIFWRYNAIYFKKKSKQFHNITWIASAVYNGLFAFFITGNTIIYLIKKPKNGGLIGDTLNNVIGRGIFIAILVLLSILLIVQTVLSIIALKETNKKQQIL
jgi:hypothetical protein